MLRLFHDDCFNIFSQLEDKSIDLVLCDMPYGTTRNKWDSIINLEKMWNHLKSLCKDRAAIVLFSQMPFSATLVASNTTMFKYNWIWEKSSGTGHLNAKKYPLKNHEDICVFCDGVHLYNPQFSEGKPYIVKKGRDSENYGIQKDTITVNEGYRYPKTILKFSSETGFHPTQKPVALIEYLVKTYSNEGDTILDFCMGSGTTGIACKNLNRKFIGIEKEKKYYDIAVTRLNIPPKKITSFYD